MSIARRSSKDRRFNKTSQPWQGLSGNARYHVTFVGHASSDAPASSLARIALPAVSIVSKGQIPRKTEIRDQDELALGSTTDELLSRLERLESLIVKQGKELAELRTAPPTPSHIGTVHQNLESPNTCIRTDETPTSDNVAPSPRICSFTDDALWLEGAYQSQDLEDIQDDMVIRVCQMRQITKQGGYYAPSSSTFAQGQMMDATKCIFVPEREEATFIIEKYLGEITYFHHVVHKPSLVKVMADLYDGLDAGKAPNKSVVMLLSSICASVCYTWTKKYDETCWFMNVSEASKQFSMWVKASLDLLDMMNRSGELGMEGIQGSILLFFVIFHVEGISRQGRHVVMQAIDMARELGLHCIDCPGGGAEAMSTTRAEIGRRLWWYLVSTDWMLAHYSMPLGGSYTLNPKHMAVNKPANANDEDIVDGQPVVDRPLSEATCVSYLLLRLRLADICRELFDYGGFTASWPNNVSYQHALQVDAKLQRFIQELPSFMTLKDPTLDDLDQSDSALAQGLKAQRCTLNLLLCRQLCKVHIPYLARGASGPAFTYSRIICLKSARTVLATAKEVENEFASYLPPRLRMSMAMRSMFLASIVLVIDTAFADERQPDRVKPEELIDAWKVLDGASSQSSTAAKFLDLSKQVLKKHKPTHPALAFSPSKRNGASIVVPFANTKLPEPVSASTFSTMPNGDFQFDPDKGFMQQACGLSSQEMDLYSVDWDSLFWSLDSSFL